MLLTGGPYREVHEWIDDPQHKNERYDITRVLEFSRMFEEKYGRDAAHEYVRHLADDVNGKFTHLVEDVQALVDKGRLRSPLQRFHPAGRHGPEADHRWNSVKKRHKSESKSKARSTPRREDNDADQFTAV